MKCQPSRIPRRRANLTFIANDDPPGKFAAGDYFVRLRVDGVDSLLIDRSVQPPEIQSVAKGEHPMTTHDSWQENNARQLGAALAELRQRLEKFCQKSASENGATPKTFRPRHGKRSRTPKLHPRLSC